MFKKIKSDIVKYKKYSGKSALVLILTQQGLWAIITYRFYNNVYESKLPSFLKKIILFFGVIAQKWIEIVTGIQLPYSAKVGNSFYIGHFGHIIINANAVIGNNCNISQGVTIGVSGRGENRGVPVLKDNIYVGANVTVAGKIVIGSNSVLGANSLVVKNVEANTTVLGVPAVKINTNDSSAYI